MSAVEQMTTSYGKIGLAHRNATDQMCRAFDKAAPLCPPEFADKLAAERTNLVDWRARIAVVGQVKAGKSSFLSALIERPGFLPSEVNPWTAVVTNLHFAHPSDPMSGGVFHFYDETAWNRIIEGDPKTQALAEDLLPGFAVDVLAEQVKSMRERARTRLGQFYELLLGKSHSYEIVTRDTLERYVCAGPERDPDAPLTGPAGRYADLTERADIYLPPGPFAAASVLTDTPGVNDPFMVRDAYTCRSLGQSDIFVLALSVHQALNDVDLALLRMLALRRDNEIVVFVNRIDELANPREDAAAVVANVREKLGAAVPDRSIQVYSGSARWAELAMNPDAEPDAFAAEIARPAVRAWLDSLNGEDERARLLQASAVPEIQSVLAAAIDEGIGRTFRQSAVRSILSTLDACGIRLSSQEQEATSPADISQDALEPDAGKDVWEREMLVHRNEIGEILASAAAAQRRELEQQLRDFVENRCVDLNEIIQRGGTDAVFEFDALSLRRSLEDAFMETYAASRSRLDGRLVEIRSKAIQTASSLVGDLGLRSDLPEMPGHEVTPLFATPSTQLTLELTAQKSWAFWRKASWDRAANLDRLARLIRSEYYPSIEYFLSLSQEALAKRGRLAILDIDQVCQAALAVQWPQIQGGSKPDPEVERSNRERALAELKQVREEISSLDTDAVAPPIIATAS